MPSQWPGEPGRDTDRNALLGCLFAVLFLGVLAVAAFIVGYLQ